MEITQQGRDKVNSLEFQQELRQFVQAWIAAGKPAEEGQRLAISRVALELAGWTDWNSPPAKEEFKRFVDAHVSEINEAFGRGLGTLMTSDVEGSAVQ